MKMVIYKNETFSEYCVTTRGNYNSYAQNAREIQRFPANEWTVKDIMDYYCQYLGSKPEDFAVFTA